MTQEQNDRLPAVVTLIILAIEVTAIIMISAATNLMGQATTNSFPLAFERVDWIATQGQSDFLTKATPRGGFVMVFRNGLLQRQGTPQGDYTSVGVSGAQKITFNATTPPGLPSGDYVTLIYFR